MDIPGEVVVGVESLGEEVLIVFGFMEDSHSHFHVGVLKLDHEIGKDIVFIGVYFHGFPNFPELFCDPVANVC